MTVFATTDHQDRRSDRFSGRLIETKQKIVHAISPHPSEERLVRSLTIRKNKKKKEIYGAR